MDKMEFNIASLSDMQCLKGFRCGFHEMDAFIQEGLYVSAQHHYCQIYTVRLADEIIALLALSFDSLNLDLADKDDMMQGFSIANPPRLADDYKDIFFHKSHYPAIEITYLAVHEKYSNQGWGSLIVEAIAEKAETQSLAGCQFLTVEAWSTKKYSAVGFYEKCGFSACAYPNPNKDTLRMFRTLYPMKVNLDE